MFKILLLLISINFLIADDLNIKIIKDIEFKNGFGQIEARPILKNVNKDVKVLGEFNVENNGNVVIKIDKVVYDGKIYNLSEEFNSKRRLKNPKTAKLNTNSKIKLSGGSHPEILAILNGEVNPLVATQNNKAPSNTNNTNNTSNTDISRSNNRGSSSNGTNRGSYSSNYPILGSNNLNDINRVNSSNNPNLNTLNNDCKGPEVKDGMAYVYVKVNGECQRKATTTNNIYKKQNTSTCPNKVDFNNLKVSIGEEEYTNIGDIEYKIKSCSYNNNLPLNKTTESCKVIPNFENKTGIVQKQYWYVLNNEKINVGSCTPTKEIISLYDDDYNTCKYRFDFDRGNAIKQTQWYYIYENKRNNIGECVDVSKSKLNLMTYPLFENTQGCPCNEVDGANLCQSKLVFNGMNNTKENATQCRYINTQGIKLINEFEGKYAFKESSKQAIKKINQYFIGNNGERVYVARDKETNIAFPYIEESCGWEHDNEKRLSYHKSRIYIEDEELRNINLNNELSKFVNGNKYEIKSCKANIDAVLYWQEQLDLIVGKKTKEYKRQVLIPQNLEENAIKWSIPLLKRKVNNKDVIPTTEDKQIPKWDSNFKANNLNIKEETKYTKWFTLSAFGVKPNKWNFEFRNASLEKAPALPNYFSIGWTRQSYKTTERQCEGGGGRDDNDRGRPRNCKDVEVTKYREIPLNNPLNTNTLLTHTYSINLPKSIVVKPTNIVMNENIIFTKEPDSIEYKIIKKETLDSNKECIKDESTKECKLADTQTYTKGVTFTPDYSNVVNVNEERYCKNNEIQSFEDIEENVFSPRAKRENESYYDYIQDIKNEALNVNNYSKVVTKVTCKIEGNESKNINAYLIGALINQNKPNSLTKLEIETLENMQIELVEGDTWWEKRGLDGKYGKKQILKTTFNTKKNWANNQTIYEYEMYRPFRRPDGSIFKLYERQGFFTEPQVVECLNCNKNKKLN